jgi:hypothetical protein
MLPLHRVAGCSLGDRWHSPRDVAESTGLSSTKTSPVLLNPTQSFAPHRSEVG